MQSRQRQARGPVLAAVMLASLVVTGLSVTADAAGKVTYARPSAVVFSEASCEGDWVEIQNTDPKYVANLANWFIADAMPADPANSFRFPKTKLLKPGARVVVKASSLPFKLGCGSDKVFLARSRAAIVDQISVPNLADGFTWGRVNSMWQANLPTPAKPNQLAPPNAVVDRAAWIYSDMRSYQIRLTVDPTQLQSLVTTPKTYVAAKFQMQDAAGSLLPATGPLNVGLRVKGSVGTLTHNAYGPGGLTIAKDKVSLKIKFNFSVKGQHFFGLEKLTLNSMVQDPTMTHETMAYKLFRDIGVLAPRTGFANVYINDSLRGLFLNLEPYDEVSMTWHVPTLQHIIEGQTTGLNPQLTAAAIETAFQIDAGSKQDIKDFRALVTAVEASSTMTPAIAARLDIERLGVFVAVEKFINHWDGYSGSVPWGPNNFYLVDNARGEFQFMPSGPDATWQYYTDVEGLDAKGAEPFTSGDGSLFARCMLDEVCASAYRRSLAYAAQQAPAFLKYANDLRSTHEAARLADTVRRSSAAYESWSWDEQVKFLAQRPVDVASYLKTVVTGTIRWTPTALKLTKGTPLTTAQLNAYSDVLGTFTYSSALGTKLPVGKTTVTVTFTPSDSQLTGPQTTSRVFTVS